MAQKNVENINNQESNILIPETEAHAPSFTNEEMSDLLAKLEKLSYRINSARSHDLIHGYVRQIAEIVHNTPLKSLKEACDWFTLGDTTRRDLTTLVDVTIITERRKIQRYNID